MRIGIGRINNSINWIWPNEKSNIIYFFFMFSFIFSFAGMCWLNLLQMTVFFPGKKWNKWQIPEKRVVDRLKWMAAEQTHIFCAKHNFQGWIIFEVCIVSFIISLPYQLLKNQIKWLNPESHDVMSYGHQGSAFQHRWFWGWLAFLHFCCSMLACASVYQGG